MESSAPWRQDALKRVEKLRKADFLVSVRDAHGNALPNTEVSLSQFRHHFGFGAAVQPRHLFGTAEPQREQFYREVVSHNFHRVTIANGLKWKHYEEQKPLVETCLEWCVQQQLPVRGHCLVWPRFRRIPGNLGYLKDDRTALRKAIEEHVAEFAAMYDEPLIEWDVLNEPFTEHEFMDLLGDDVVHDWFRIAGEANPRLTRYINDYGVLTRSTEQHQQFYFDYIQSLLDASVAVQGIGFQGHIPKRFEPTPPSELLATMDRFATLGLPLQVTEFDFETIDEDLQARYTSDFLLAVFSHPAMTGLVTWTPFEYARGQGPKPDAAFYDHTLREKPNGLVWKTRVNDDWRTSIKLVTDGLGMATFRCFKVSYNAEASLGAARVSSQAKLIENNDQFMITLS
jgi:GH35 family endo-1,4-beta-xylanase